MPLYTKTGGKDFKIPEAGMWFGRCIAVIDLGTHINDKFKNDKGESKKTHLVQIMFELPGQMMEYEGEQKPMVSTKRYTLSHHKKSQLRKDLEGWYGKKFQDAELDAKGGFDVEKLLGRGALLNLTHSDDGEYCNIASINPVMKGSAEPPAINKHRFFSLATPDPAMFLSLSAKTRRFIRESEEAQFIQLPPEPNDPKKPASDADQDAPF